MPSATGSSTTACRERGRFCADFALGLAAGRLLRRGGTAREVFLPPAFDAGREVLFDDFDGAAFFGDFADFADFALLGLALLEGFDFDGFFRDAAMEPLYRRTHGAYSVSAHLPVALDDVLLRGELLQAHGAEGVQPRGGDADFSAQPQLAAVVEARRRVHHHP